MPFRKHLLLPLLGLALLLGGCGPSVSYSYIPPTSDAGLHCVSPVSYTHLDVYKRQAQDMEHSVTSPTELFTRASVSYPARVTT